MYRHSAPNQNDTGDIAMTDKILTQTRLKELLDYDPDTGVFRWRIHKPPIILGKEAGNKSTIGYMRINVDVKSYYSHRLAWLYMYGHLPENEIDHINHNRSDNRIANLREVTHSQNHRNQSLQKSNTSGVVGVCWVRSKGKWLAQITAKGKHMYLGIFESFGDAVAARKKAEIIHRFHKNHGDRKQDKDDGMD